MKHPRIKQNSMNGPNGKLIAVSLYLFLYRFGTQHTVITKAESDKRKQRLARFAESTESVDKMARRAERFSQ